MPKKPSACAQSMLRSLGVEAWSLVLSFLESPHVFQLRAVSSSLSQDVGASVRVLTLDRSASDTLSVLAMSFQNLENLVLLSCKELVGDLGPLTGLGQLQCLVLKFGKGLRGDLGPISSLGLLSSLCLSNCFRLTGKHGERGFIACGSSTHRPSHPSLNTRKPHSLIHSSTHPLIHLSTHPLILLQGPCCN